MGGFHSTVIGEHRVKYGDICEVDVVDGDQIRTIACTFIEVTEDGDRWFSCLVEGDSVRGDTQFPDYYAEVIDARFKGRPTDEKYFIGDGI